MAEEPDKDSKTEDPSEKKISDAIRKGNVPHSREPAILASFLAMLAVATFQLGPASLSLSSALMMFLEKPEQWLLEGPGAALHLVQRVFVVLLAFMAPIFAVFVVAALAAALSQNPPRIVFRRIRPEFSRISPRKGLKRIFGAQGWVEFLKALFKFLSVSVIVAVLLRSEAGHIMQTARQGPIMLPGVILQVALKLVAAVVLVSVVLAVADFAWSRRYWWLNLRMTRQEVKQEHKDQDGDPVVKARRLSLARERLRRSMMAAVPQATVVITNPTHYAVALRYEAERDAAPVVVAKGQNLIALSIRRIASEAGVPVVENKTLARALHAQAEVNQMIPEEFYPAVAEIIHYVMTQARRAGA